MAELNAGPAPGPTHPPHISTHRPWQETDRRLREEQDAEYQRSLEADRQREEARAAAARAAEEAERAAREAAERARCASDRRRRCMAAVGPLRLLLPLCLTGRAACRIGRSRARCIHPHIPMCCTQCRAEAEAAERQRAEQEAALQRRKAEKRSGLPEEPPAGGCRAGSGRSGSGERAGHAAPCRPTAPPQGIKGHPVPAQPAHKASHCRLHISMDPEEGHATGLGGWAAPAGMAGRPAGTVPASRAANHLLTRPCQRLLLMAAGTPGATTLRIRLPDGSTHQRRFLASDPLQVGAPSCCPACDASATAFPLVGGPLAAAVRACAPPPRSVCQR